MISNEEFIRKNKVVIVDDDKNTKLHYAAALGNLDELDRIIESGQKLDPENYLGWTPLMMAVRNHNNVVTDILLSKGADATKKNRFGINVFLVSVTCGDVDNIERILNHLLCGGVSRQSLQRVLSPISLAILFGHAHIFKYLLDRSFDPNAATPLTGITPIMFAAAMKNQKAIKRLVQHQADITQKDCLERTASDILQFGGHGVDFCNKSNKSRPQNIPMIIINPHTRNSPQLQLTPYVNNHVNSHHLHHEKSSNTQTPNMLCSPAITPITPQILPTHQMFFGPNFTPSHFINPSPPGSYSFLNANITPSAVFCSPVVPQAVCHPNYA